MSRCKQTDDYNRVGDQPSVNRFFGLGVWQQVMVGEQFLGRFGRRQFDIGRLVEIGRGSVARHQLG